MTRYSKTTRERRNSDLHDSREVLARFLTNTAGNMVLPPHTPWGVFSSTDHPSTERRKQTDRLQRTDAWEAEAVIVTWQRHETWGHSEVTGSTGPSHQPQPAGGLRPAPEFKDSTRPSSASNNSWRQSAGGTTLTGLLLRQKMEQRYAKHQ